MAATSIVSPTKCRQWWTRWSGTCHLRSPSAHVFTYSSNGRSFNVHGVIYVDDEGKQPLSLCAECRLLTRKCRHCLPHRARGSVPVPRPYCSQGRAGVHCCSRTYTQEHRRIDQRPRQVVVYPPGNCSVLGSRMASVVPQGTGSSSFLPGAAS